MDKNKKRDESKDYINNEDFCNALMNYKAQVKKAKEENKSIPKIPDYIGLCIQKIADNAIRRPRSDKSGPAFLNYSFREEMVSDAIENCFRYLDNFDENITKNPFAYFSQIVYYAFLRRIALEKKELYIKYKSAINYGIFDALTSLPESGDATSSFEIFDNLVDFVQEYEKKDLIKKQKIQNSLKKPKKQKKNLETIMEN